MDLLVLLLLIQLLIFLNKKILISNIYTNKNFLYYILLPSNGKSNFNFIIYFFYKKSILHLHLFKLIYNLVIINIIILFPINLIKLYLNK